MHALIRIDSHRTARVGEPESPTRQHPQLQQVPDQALAQLDLQGLDKPALHHVEDQQHAGEHEEHNQLEQEIMQIAARERIVERLVPAVEANLGVGGDHQDHEHGNREQRQRAAHVRTHHRAPHLPKLAQEAQLDGLVDFGRGVRVWRRFRHRRQDLPRAARRAATHEMNAA